MHIYIPGSGKGRAVISKINTSPAIATWELWTLAQTLIATHGDEAESYAQSQHAEAQQRGDEAQEIVWSGVISQLDRIRAK